MKLSFLGRGRYVLTEYLHEERTKNVNDWSLMCSTNRWKKETKETTLYLLVVNAISQTKASKRITVKAYVLLKDIFEYYFSDLLKAIGLILTSPKKLRAI